MRDENNPPDDYGILVACVFAAMIIIPVALMSIGAANNCQHFTEAELQAAKTNSTSHSDWDEHVRMYRAVTPRIIK